MLEQSKVAMELLSTLYISQMQLNSISIEIQNSVVDGVLTINNNQNLQNIETLNKLQIDKLKLYDCINVIPILSNFFIKDLTMIACNLKSFSSFYLPNLQVLTLGDYQNYSKLDILRIEANCSQLKELHIVGYTVDITPLLPLKLGQLDIKDCIIINIELISNLKYLEELVITDCRHKDDNKQCSEQVLTFKKLKKLTKLNICQNSKLQIQSIESCQKLKEVRIQGYTEDLSALQYLRQLTILEITFCNLSYVDFLRPLLNLQELYLNDNKIVYVSALEQLQKLIRLNICNNFVVDAPPNNRRFHMLNKGFQKQPTKQQLKRANILRYINSPTLLLNKMKYQRRQLMKNIDDVKKNTKVQQQKFTYNQIMFTGRVVQLFQMIAVENDY
ncbi:leucine-rich_repeat domain-containing protein [Hexamita inflata]|uniref:Leucine-rich repeat domain-containing protein n=1 Tax=Hexamita inflata TaxID=28002 RepID=A0AA86P913_9EUKA|nr:leucine-rich repeat domain-containing protein [Hexamita inflata]